MSYNHVLVLVKEAYRLDTIGQEVRDPENDVKTEVFCRQKSVTRSEFYSAAVAGLHPQHVFVIHSFEYSGEQSVEFEGETYRVLRTYQDEKSREEIELVCG